MIYHGRPWNTVKSWSWCMTMIYHDRSRLWNWPCSIMIYHDKTMKKSCLSMIIISWSIMIDHGQPWNMVKLWSRNDHGLTTVKSGPFHKRDRSWSIMIFITVCHVILWLLCYLNRHWSICTMWPYSKQWYLGAVQLEIDIALPAVQYQYLWHATCVRDARARHALVNKGQMHSTMTRLCNALFSSILHQFSWFNHRFMFSSMPNRLVTHPSVDIIFIVKCGKTAFGHFLHNCFLYFFHRYQW